MADEFADLFEENNPPSKRELAAVKVTQGATGGFAGEIGGVVNAARTTGVGRFLADKLLGVPEVVPPAGAPGQGVVDAYRAGRNAIDKREEEIEAAYPVASKVIEGGTALVTGIATGALAGPGRLAQVGLAGAEGLASGVGYSKGDLTKGEVGKVAKDAAISGAISAALPAVTAGVKAIRDRRAVTQALKKAGVGKGADELGKTVLDTGEGLRPRPGETGKEFKKRVLQEAAKKRAGAAKEDVRQQILNEVNEGDRGFKTTPTQQKHLDKAGDAIADEVTTGPDATIVRKAIQGEAKPGRALLKPVIRKVNSEKDAAYDTFAQHGRNLVDPVGYKNELQRRAQDAINAGDKTGADDLLAIASDFSDMVTQRTVPLDLKSLRKWTTGLQNAAAGAVGALNLHKSAGQKAVMSAHASEIMDDLLTEAAKGEKVLEAAADTIRKKNRRLNGLLTVEKALELRQYKEATGESLGRQAAKAALYGAGGAGVTGATTYGITDDPGKALKAAAIGAIGGATPKLGQIGLRQLRSGSTNRAIKRGLQDEAILAAGGIPERNKLGTSGRLAGKVAAPYVTKPDEPAPDTDDYGDLFAP